MTSSINDQLIHRGDPLKMFRGVLREKEIPFQEQGKEIRFRLLLRGVGCEFFVRFTSLAVAVFAYLPIFAPLHRRGEVGEALAIANWQSAFGAFEMDSNDGQVRFHY